MPDQSEEQRDPAPPGAVLTDEVPGRPTETDPAPFVVDAAAGPDGGHARAAVAPGAKPAAGVQAEMDSPDTQGDQPTDAVVAYRLGAQLLRELMLPEDDEPEEPDPA